jgi:hypothetical protein
MRMPVQVNKPKKSKFPVVVLLMLAVVGVRSCGGSTPSRPVGGQFAASTNDGNANGGNRMHRTSLGGGDLFVGGDGQGNVYYLDSYRSSYSSGR